MQQYDELLSRQVLNSYIIELQKKYKKKTVKRKIANTKSLFNYLVDEEVLDVNPFYVVKT